MKPRKLVLMALLVSGGFTGAYSTAFAQAAHDGSGPETRLGNTANCYRASPALRCHLYGIADRAVATVCYCSQHHKRLVHDVRDLGGLEGWIWGCCLHDQLDPRAGTDW